MGTVIVILVLAAVVGLIIFKMVRNKKKGISSCGCDCRHCASGGLCHGTDKLEKDKK